MAPALAAEARAGRGARMSLRIYKHSDNVYNTSFPHPACFFVYNLYNPLFSFVS